MDSSEDFFKEALERINAMSPEEIQKEFNKALEKANRESEQLMRARVIDFKKLHEPMTI